MYNPCLKAEISANVFTGHGGLYRRPFMRFSSTPTKSRLCASAISPSQPVEPLFYSISSISLQFPVISLGYFRSSPSKKFMSLTTNPGILSPSHIDSVFCNLEPIQPEELIGKWDGFILATGHPLESELDESNCCSHTFDSTEDVAPFIVAKNGRLVQYEDWGHGSLHEVKYLGTVSAALIYDEHPVMVYYRAARPNIVAGIIESRKFGRSGKFYFYLKRE